MTKKKMMINTDFPLKKAIILFLACITFGACTKMDSTYEDFIKGGEIRYSKRPDSIGIYPGHNRVRVWMLVSAPNISKCKVYWNNRANSIEIPVMKTLNADTVSAIIENLNEEIYTFEFLTYDDKGNPSIPVDTIGNAYGDIYVNSLNNRLIKTAGLVAGNVKLTWYDEANAQAIRTEILYKDQSGTPHTVTVPLSEVTTTIAERPLGDSIQYRNLYLPHVSAIDIFYAKYQTLYLK